MKIPSWVLRLVAKFASKKLGLTEGNVEDKKKWYQSKSILNAIVVFLVGVYALAQTTLAPQFGWALPNIPEWIFTILGAIGIYSRVVADKSIG